MNDQFREAIRATQAAQISVMNEDEQCEYWKEDAREFFLESPRDYPVQFGAWPYGMVDSLLDFAARYTVFRKKEEVK